MIEIPISKYAASFPPGRGTMALRIRVFDAFFNVSPLYMNREIGYNITNYAN